MWSDFVPASIAHAFRVKSSYFCCVVRGRVNKYRTNSDHTQFFIAFAFNTVFHDITTLLHLTYDNRGSTILKSTHLVMNDYLAMLYRYVDDAPEESELCQRLGYKTPRSLCRLLPSP